jgi:ribosome recycling factor
VDEEVELALEEAKEHMDKALASLKLELHKIRTGRASTGLLDGISAEAYGSLTPLNQLANLSVPDPRLIVVSPFDSSTMGAIEKAIHASNLGLTPSNDGKVIRIPIPALNEERRKELVKQAKKIAEDHKVGIREARREVLNELKKLEGNGLSKDDRRRAEKSAQDLTDAAVKKIDEVTVQKESDILKV